MLFKDFFLIYDYFGCMYVCVPCTCQKRTLDPQELKLQMVVNCHEVLGIEPVSSEPWFQISIFVFVFSLKNDLKEDNEPGTKTMTLDSG